MNISMMKMGWNVSSVNKIVPLVQIQKLDFNVLVAIKVFIWRIDLARNADPIASRVFPLIFALNVKKTLLWMGQIVSVKLEDILMIRNALIVRKDVYYVLRLIIARDVNLDITMKHNYVWNALKTVRLVLPKRNAWAALLNSFYWMENALKTKNHQAVLRHGFS